MGSPQTDPGLAVLLPLPYGAYLLQLGCEYSSCSVCAVLFPLNPFLHKIEYTTTYNFAYPWRDSNTQPVCISTILDLTGETGVSTVPKQLSGFRSVSQIAFYPPPASVAGGSQTQFLSACALVIRHSI